MTTIAFIGLGIMGEPMAGHLIDAGHDVIGVNRSPEPVDRLAERGARGADTVAEAVTEADIVITMVPDSPDVEDIAYGDDGIYANAKPGTLHIDCSSIRPDVARRLAETGAQHGVKVVDAPVSGARPAPSKPRCRSWSGVTRRTSRRPGRSWRRSARWSCTSVRLAPTRPSRPPTN